MDDRITRIERLAALHREGALTDDEFRDEKLRVLSGRAMVEEAQAEPAARPPEPPPPPRQPPPPSADPLPAFFEEEAAAEPEVAGDPYAPAPRTRSRAGWWLGGLLVLVVALAGAVWFARSIEVADAPRSSVGTAAGHQVAEREDPVSDTAAVEEEPTDLSNALVFSDANQCEFGEEAERAFEALLTQNGDEWRSEGPVRLDGVSATPKLQVINKDDVIEGGRIYTSSARLPGGTLWNGLKLSRLVRSHGFYPDTDDFDERSITFLEDPERVQRTLRRLGVSVPIGQNGRELEDGACGGVMTISAISGGSALTCQWGC